MTGSVKFSLVVLLFAAAVLTIGLFFEPANPQAIAQGRGQRLSGSRSRNREAQQSVKVLYKTVKVGDLDIVISRLESTPMLCEVKHLRLRYPHQN